MMARKYMSTCTLWSAQRTLIIRSKYLENNVLPDVRDGVEGTGEKSATYCKLVQFMDWRIENFHKTASLRVLPKSVDFQWENMMCKCKKKSDENQIIICHNQQAKGHWLGVEGILTSFVVPVIMNMENYLLLLL